MLLNRCVVCGKDLEKGRLCPVCKERVESQYFDRFCTRCSSCYSLLPFEGYRCRFCEEKPGTKLYVISPYEGFSGKIIESLKFFGNKELSAVLGQVFTDCITRLGIQNDCLLVPVPSSIKGKRQRGFDHMLLAARKTGLPCSSLLVRTEKPKLKKHTVGGSLKPKEKLFMLDPKKERPRASNIIVIDDIIKTGKTIFSALKEIEGLAPNIIGMVWLSSSIK